jgi:hypothetical protein
MQLSREWYTEATTGYFTKLPEYKEVTGRVRVVMKIPFVP